MPKTVQLRRYNLVPEKVDEFLSWWNSRLVPARAAHGFTVEFALLNRVTSEFTWAVSLPTDATEFAAIEGAYAASPERAAAFDGAPEWTELSVVALVDTIV